MPIKVPVPDLGVSVIEAKVSEWKKNIGDAVKRDEEIGILETDKITTPITAFKDGILVAVFAQPGDVVPVGQTIAVIQKEGESLSKGDIEKLNPKKSPAPEPTPEPQPTPAPEPTRSSNSSPVKTSPAIRKYCRENDIDPATITGSGPGGRIQMKDVLSFKKPKISEKNTSEPTNTETRNPMNGAMAAMAKHMVHSVSTSPHFLIVDEADMSETLAVYRKAKEQLKEKNVRVTLMSFFVRAAVQALKDFPRMNVSLDGEELVTKNYRNIGMAASVGESLIVPVIKNADFFNLENLALEINRLSVAAQENKLTMQDITGGTFTITNAGMFGGPLMSAPIINQPEAGILGIHTVKERAVVENGNITIKPMVYISLSSDHRMVDGVLAVRFLCRFKELLEHPGLLATGPIS